MFELIELMFFAYRDFVGDADHLLARLPISQRASPRFAFCREASRLTIAELLDILQITSKVLIASSRN